ncbi:uncharacterized protein SAMN04487977_1072 [Treponema bryantii]|uniref:Uncharacterized protein n=1 Tax=Treponema bryantii TaxID=163 RepID=A0A1H9HGY2_9SPIR|nr:radical SAM protein [Treponema bryantii]SEQ61621.1 uncharacterized protein SAMN04487977_1072 [Treponema bryantii]
MLNWSKRNYMFNSEKYGWLLYAGLSNSFFHLSEELKERIDLYLKNEAELDDDILQKFQKTGVLSRYTDDEMDRMSLLNWGKMQAYNKELRLTLATTLACNFRCSYCYEKENYKDVIMTEELADKIIEFILMSKKESVSIEWYGGEPLLNINIIKYMNKKLKENNIKNTQTIVTNGYLLTKENIEMLHEYNISGIQITLDGDKDTHNKRRPHVTNPDSFSRIFDNLELLYMYSKRTDYKPYVSIRVNIDKDNENDYSKVLNLIKSKFYDFYDVYFAFVTTSNSCSDISDAVFGNKEEKEFIDRLKEKYSIDYKEYYPKNHGCFFCAAQLLDNYVIDPDGYMYKCWDDVGDINKAVYSLKDKKFSNVSVESDYIIKTLAIFNDKCKNCFMLYSCQGGCPFKALNKKEHCPVIKDNINEYLEKHYENSKKKDFVY